MITELYSENFETYGGDVGVFQVMAFLDRENWLSAVDLTYIIDFTKLDDGTPITSPPADQHLSDLSIFEHSFLNIRSYYNTFIYSLPGTTMRILLPPDTYAFGAELHNHGGLASNYIVRISTGDILLPPAGNLPWLQTEFFGVISSQPMQWVEFRLNNTNLIMDRFYATGQRSEVEARDDAGVVYFGGALVVSAAEGVLANDEGVSRVTGVEGQALDGELSLVGKYGTLLIFADGSYHYTAHKGGLGPVVAQDRFEYTVDGGASATLTITLTPKGVNHVVAGGDDGATSAGNGPSLLQGGNGEDVLIGGRGTSILIGGAGDDILTGGTGKNTFVFNEGFGRDVITNFKTGRDVLQFGELFDSWDDILIEETEAGARIVYDEGNHVTLQGVEVSALSASDFLLA